MHYKIFNVVFIIILTALSGNILSEASQNDRFNRESPIDIGTVCEHQTLNCGEYSAIIWVGDIVPPDVLSVSAKIRFIAPDDPDTFPNTETQEIQLSPVHDLGDPHYPRFEKEYSEF